MQLTQIAEQASVIADQSLEMAALRNDLTKQDDFIKTDTPQMCDTATLGETYFDLSLNKPCFCDGEEWRQFDGGGSCD